MWAPISPAGTLILSVRFDKAPQSLPAVVTTGVAPSTVPLGLRAFEERRAIGAGQFVTEADLRKHDMQRMTAIVRQLSGVMVECPRGITPPSCYAQSTRQRSNTAMLGGGCRADIYVDGVVWTETDLETFAVNDYAVVEYCNGPATIPVQYNRTGSSCGGMLLWRRER